ncbi:MAG TPA: PAS-domain containing protein [Xanthobacteraceae bacterium]|nr:PAS-domain containing protein [Xanthobacteraceae bacterium]
MRSGGPRAGPRLGGFGIATITVVAPASAGPALAADGGPASHFATLITAFAALERHEIAALALTLGVVCFAVVTAIALVRTHARAAARETAARAEIIALRDQADRANALLLAEPQVIIAWPASGEEPEIVGDASIVTPTPVPRRVLAFGTWLDPQHARELEQAVAELRASGKSFPMTMPTLTGRFVEIEGRAIGGRAILRIKDVSGIKGEYVKLAAQHHGLLRDIDTMRALIESLPSPIWARHADGRLAFVNSAYAIAVEAKNAADAVARNLDLLDRSGRESLERAHVQHEPFVARLPVIVAGKRRMFDIFDLIIETGSAGIGIDATEIETMRAEMARMVEAHRRTLDQLPTAVAIFGADQRLAFYNAAYRALWGLPAEFLDQHPTDSAVLDRLRAARKLPEQADFRAWKAQLHAAYRALESHEHQWHLPDGRTLRVVTTPSPEGGITYLFDDVTERLDLERRFDAMIRVQRETLDNLSEGVAVFGSDGRLRLYNPVFAGMWQLAPSALAERPHIEAVIAACRALHGDEATWQALRGAVTGLEQRATMARRIERRDGSVVDCATVPLPDGATLVTFHDVTDTVNVERALRERNDALEAADNLKSDFVHHVSYELRSPLTNIIGFAQLLNEPVTGALTDKQREYLGYITASSAALLAIINDILDLATIDAGAMTLNLAPVDIRATMEAAAEGVRDRLAEHDLKLDIRAAAGIGSFTGDERRIRQILYNLLSNAIGFSPKGETITLAADRRSDAVRFSVTDRGSGIPAEIMDRVFDRFETHTSGSRHRGTGLGLSIVRSFVELHGGTVTIDSAVDRGTTVTCVFPLEKAVTRAAAE